MKNLILLLTLCLPMLTFAQTTASLGIVTTPASTDLKLRTNTSSTDRLVILNAAGATQGYVGINTAAPTERLHVVGNSLVTGNATTSGNLLFGSTASTGLLHLNSTTNNFTLRLNSTNRLTVLNSNGYVGIGASITTPTEMLQVSGNILSNGNVTSGGNIVSTGNLLSTAGIVNVNHATNNLVLQTNGTTRMTVLSSGSVGIGKTPSASYALDVNGTVNANNLLVTNINNVPFVNSQWTSVSNNINFTTGTVSIGTTTAPSGYKLAIGGKMIATEVVVKLTADWPDYVFEKEYSLMPLSQVEQYIHSNKHLPGVPSANEVKDNGVAVGEMNAVLLKKIEELTLYVIELKKENEAQQKALNELANKK